MIDLSAMQCRFGMRVLFLVVTVWGTMLGAATFVENLVVWLLLLSAFYLPFIFIVLFVRRIPLLMLSVLIVHTIVVASVFPVLSLAFGAEDELTRFAVIAFIDVPLLPFYLILEPHPNVLLPLSLVVGGAIYALIAYLLGRLCCRVGR